MSAHLIHPGHSAGPSTPTPEENPVSPTPTTTDRATWPQQIHLPGQAAAPEGPIDLTTMFVMHFAFRRDLAAFATAAAATPVEDRRTWAALAERWALFAAILHHHHHGEDTGLWPLLAERSDEAGREVLAAMEAEHADGHQRCARNHHRTRAALLDDVADLHHQESAGDVVEGDRRGDRRRRPAMRFLESDQIEAETVEAETPPIEGDDESAEDDPPAVVGLIRFHGDGF